MENCKHVSQVSSNVTTFLLDPGKWLCYACGTTESVWACLSCGNVACGRYIMQHALDHYRASKHALSMEINDGYVFCYDCDEYILNDTVSGDIRLLRDVLSVVANPEKARSARILRSEFSAGPDREEYNKVRQMIIKFRRISVMSRVFAAWRLYVSSKKEKKKTADEARGGEEGLMPGLTGLRNLGNTCYMNSVLQVLSNLDAFRDLFLSACHLRVSSPCSADKIGGSSRSRRRSCSESDANFCAGTSDKAVEESGNEEDVDWTDRLPESADQGRSKLSSEILALLQTMWSGKLSLAIPQNFLEAVWNRVPSFKGYRQQDAQEFLCEILDKLGDEIAEQKARSGPTSTGGKKRVSSGGAGEDQDNPAVADIIQRLFNGQIQSTVTCGKCGHCSKLAEPFADLSLEFPEMYQKTKSLDQVCPLTSMLSHFTATENLGKVYECPSCSNSSDADTDCVGGSLYRSTRRRSRQDLQRVFDADNTAMTTEASKQLKLLSLPKILRLHLKRFRWSGRNAREKISTRVDFGEELDLREYCVGAREGGPRCTAFGLCGVIIHHGRGFNQGHYTSYCWNSKGQFWLHCNDARLQFCSLDDVLGSQAYILFYSRRESEETPKGSDTESAPIRKRLRTRAPI